MTAPSPDAGHFRARIGLHQIIGAGDDMVDLAIIHAPRGADQRRFLGRGMDDEPRVNRDAVSADAGAGREDIDARVTVGEADHLPHVHPQLVRNDRQFIGEGDVNITIGVLDQLAHFRRARIGGDASAAHEQLVKRQRLSRAARGNAAD